MATVAVLLNLEEGAIASVLQEAAEKLHDGEREVVLDFWSVHRLTAGEVRAVEEFTRAAEEKGVKVVVRRLGVDLYRALKLAKLGARFSMVA